MASVQKFHAVAVCQEIRHNHRLNETTSNPDIDFNKSENNDYSLTPNHEGMFPYDYYRARLKELYIYDPRRTDINTAFGWVVSLPREITNLNEEKQFFHCVADFLNERYRSENTISITIHRDEGGQPHLHYLGIPAVPNNMKNEQHPQDEKLSCKEVINRQELRAFHADLQNYIRSHGICAQVYTGVTAGHNRSVAEMKRDTLADLRAEVKRLQGIERKYNELLREINHPGENRWDRHPDNSRERK